MGQVNVGIKKLREDAVIPSYAKAGDAGMDLTAVDVVYKEDIDCYEYHTGIAVEIPKGYVGLIFPRSSNRKTNSYLTNHVGVIDSGYRGEILVCFKHRTSEGQRHNWRMFADLVYNLNKIPEEERGSSYQPPLHYKPYNVGDRIAQLMIIPYPEVHFILKDELSDTERGGNGHGSTGK